MATTGIVILIALWVVLLAPAAMLPLVTERARCGTAEREETRPEVTEPARVAGTDRVEREAA